MRDGWRRPKEMRRSERTTLMDNEKRANEEKECLGNTNSYVLTGFATNRAAAVNFRLTVFPILHTSTSVRVEKCIFRH